MSTKKPLCEALRCKELYVHGTLEADVCDDTTSWWCALTQRVVGPDEAPAFPEDCGPGRRCFQGKNVA